MRVYVYKNIRTGKYSVMHRGKVIDHVERIMLSNVEFRVREAGRLRVLREKRKNVHAFVIGDVVDDLGCFGTDKDGRLPAKVNYNPYRSAHFTWDGHPVKTARAVILNEQGVWAAYLED